jgi:putative transposase
MGKKRNNYSARLKFQVALEAARGLKTTNQIASEHGVHPNLVSYWKRRLMDQGASVFGKATGDHHREQQAQESELYEQIGRLKMELEWLKKKAARFS